MRHERDARHRRIAMLACWGVCLTAMPSAAYAQGPDPQVVADTVWTLVAAMLVFFMNAGFALLETGFCRAKNAVSLLGKNFVVFAVATLAFWAVGFAVMFGAGDLIGRTGFLLVGPDNSPATGAQYEGVFPGLSWAGVPLYAKFFFQLVFAGTAATIVSGAVAERTKFVSFLVFTAVNTAVLYPLVGHWIWGGGFLARWGFFDFAGSTVVHSVGGWAALAGALVVGPRLGRYRKDGKVNALPGHSMALATAGVLILWLGWFGFNPGSTMAADPERIARIAVVTNLSAAGGILAALATSMALFGRPDLSLILNGCLAGLVAITAPCAWVTAAGSVAIGVVAGVLVVLAIPMFDRWHVDDPVGAIAVHLVNGIWGTVALGLFAAPPYAGQPGAPPVGLFYQGNGELLLTQIKGVLVVGAFMLPASLLTWAVIRALMGARVAPAEEVAGLDLAEMGMEAYPTESLVSVQALLDTSMLGRREALGEPLRPSARPLTVAFSTPTPAFGARGSNGPASRGGNGREARSPGGLSGGAPRPGAESSPSSPALVPVTAPATTGASGASRAPTQSVSTNGKRFRVVFENVSADDVARRWRDLCRRPAEQAPPEFHAVFPRVVALSGTSFQCVGDDPEGVRRSFERLFQGHGSVGTVVRVVM